MPGERLLGKNLSTASSEIAARIAADQSLLGISIWNSYAEALQEKPNMELVGDLSAVERISWQNYSQKLRDVPPERYEFVSESAKEFFGKIARKRVESLRTPSAQTEDIRLPSIPGTEKFGYEQARDAQHWTLYRRAWFEDQKAAGLLSPAQEARYSQDLADGEQNIAEFNPGFFRLFADLEGLRISSEEYGVVLPNPLEVEAYASRLYLIQAIDFVMSELGDGTDTSRTQLSVPYQGTPLTGRYLITRWRKEDYSYYKIDVFQPSRPLNIDATGKETSAPDPTYHITQHVLGGIEVSREPESEVRRTTLNALTSMHITTAVALTLNEKQARKFNQSLSLQNLKVN